MRVRSHELEGHLQRRLAPLYLLTGDEPLQIGEAADCIRARARQEGFLSREVLEADSRFDWNRLAAEANSLSLFSERRIIDLRIPSGKPGKEGAGALVEYADRPPDDTLLLITLPRLDRNQLNSKWVKQLDSMGVLVQVWPVEGQRLVPWIEQRMRSAGLLPGPQVADMLAERIEGNLLAAAQEIDKLRLLHGRGVINAEQLIDAVTDSARYDIYGLVDCALEGRVARSLRMLAGLQAEGTPAPVVLWALTREIRILVALATDVSNGRTPQQAVASRRDIWEKRRPLVSKGLSRLDLNRCRTLLAHCGRADLAIKGRGALEPWLLLREIVTGIAGIPPLSAPH